MIIRFLEVAQQELDEAIDYHESLVPNLGQIFIAELLTTLNLISRYPKAGHPLSTNTRRCRLSRFTYGLIYQATESEIIIIAVAHLHRRPNYWGKRI
ncbi:MAG: type II toxin-antitoxin system RelE/ParE family toxin [Magnetococcales bacterium]|nr:type II toxin-antitoxin system RelE/ParE family toxin [Magnetococcales bacterium]